MRQDWLRPSTLYGTLENDWPRPHLDLLFTWRRFTRPLPRRNIDTFYFDTLKITFRSFKVQGQVNKLLMFQVQPLTCVCVSVSGHGLQPVQDPGGGHADEDFVWNSFVFGSRSLHSRHHHWIQPGGGRLESRCRALYLVGSSSSFSLLHWTYCIFRPHERHRTFTVMNGIQPRFTLISLMPR